MANKKKKKFHWVPHIIRHDFWRKFFALIFAMLVTATVYSDKRKHEAEIFVIHNVQPTLNLERGYVWRVRNLQQVSLTLRGPRTQLFDLKPEDFTLDYMIGEQEYKSRNKNEKQYVRLKAEDVRCRHPKGALLQVLEIKPSEYTFEIDKIVTREIKLEAVFDEADTPYKVERSRLVDRKTVQVTGPLRILEKYKSIQTLPIPLKNQVADFTTNIGLRPIDGLSYDNNQVTVSVKLKKILKKEFDNINLSLALPPAKSERLTVEKVTLPDRVKVIVTGEAASLNKITADDLLVYVDLADISRAGTYKDVPILCSMKRHKGNGMTAVSVRPLVIPEIIVAEKQKAPPVEIKPVEKAEEKKAAPEKTEVKPAEPEKK